MRPDEPVRSDEMDDIHQRLAAHTLHHEMAQHMSLASDSDLFKVAKRLAVRIDGSGMG